MNSVMSLRITIAYLLMAVKMVTELLLLWSIETTLSVFDYLMQQASSELNYMPFCLRYLVLCSKEKNFVIFSDSMSSLQSINGFNLDSDLVQKFLKDYTVLAKNGKNIIVCWIPRHVGILCNEKADAAAKSALSLPVTRMKLPATGMYPRITKLIFDEWQEVWNCCAGNKLHAITPTVDYYKQKTCLSCHGRVLLNRLRIGHTRLTHSFLLSGDDLPECGSCQCPLTVKHILVECVDLKDVRNKHFVASFIKDLFNNIESHKIINFIKETCFYKQL